MNAQKSAYVSPVQAPPTPLAERQERIRGLVKDAMRDEEYRWIEIGSEVEEALREEEFLTPRGKERLEKLLAERDSRLAHVGGSRKRRGARGRS